jgi:cobalt-zinc-cadmium efflux system outer membrane protein
MLSRLSLLIAVLSVGCAAPAPVLHVERAADQITGVENAIVFRNDPGPIDLADDRRETLTLGDAVRLALRADPQIQAALARVRSAEADTQQARLLPNPVVSLTVRSPIHGGMSVITPAISEDLISILTRPRRATAADHRLNVAVGEALSTVVASLFDVQEKYFTVQAGDAEAEVLAGRRKLLDKLLEIAKARLAGGEGIGLDVTTVQAQILNLETEISLKEIDRNEARITLARLLGQPSGAAGWKITPWQAPPPVKGRKEQWVRAALLTRADMQTGRWELAALGDEVALTSFAPWEGAAVGVEAERDADWIVGPSVASPVPLFDFGKYKRRKAVAAVIEARHKYLLIGRMTVEEVRKAYDTFNATQAVLQRSRTELMPLLERRRQQAEAAYRAGESDLTTLLIAEEELQDANTKLVDLEQKTSLAYLRLQRAVGGPGQAAEVEAGAATTQPSATTKP